MAIQFKEALLYPWQGERWKDTILWPGLLTYAYILVCLMMGFLAAIWALLTGSLSLDTFDWGPQVWQSRVSTGTGASYNGYNLFTLPAQIAYTCFMAGFQWHFLTGFQNQGIQCAPPHWLQQWKTFFVDGFKVWGFYTLLSMVLSLVLIPLASLQWWGSNFLNTQQGAFSVLNVFILMLPMVLAASIAWILAVPFVLSPLVFSAQSRQFKDLWELKAAVKKTLPRYWVVWFTFFLCLVVGILYMVGTFFLVITILGIFALPFVYGAMVMTMWHLLAQAYTEPSAELATTVDSISN
jgi:hypothetical protein